MEKEFAPYPDALELKSIGFDEPCLGLFSEDGSFLYADVFSFREPYSPSEFKEGVDEGVCYINSEILEELVTAPTFSQAFRFFRDKYALFHSIVYLDDNSGDGEFSFEILNKKGNQQQNGEYFEYNSYQEAELACLRKLIEIVKRK